MGLSYPAGPGSAVLRIGRWSESSQVYLVTFTTRLRRPLFRDFARACRAGRVIHDGCASRHASVPAWVLMPDHVHLLLDLGDESLSRHVGQIKAAIARVLHAAEPGLGAIWERGFHDHAVRQEEDLVELARYVVLNPVRAGLVSRCWDYPFWNSIWIGNGRGESDVAPRENASPP